MASPRRGNPAKSLNLEVKTLVALTPEEVINKRFQATKFKEGYNPEEVDDFLDEIVIELRRLNAENSSLKRQLEDAENRAAEAEANAGATTAVPAVAVQEPTTEEVTTVSALADGSAPAGGATSAASLLAMAQKVHDDYVLEGQREKERLLSEGRDEAAVLLTTAQEERSKVLGDLTESKTKLETTVEELRGFERQYREGLRKYLEDQLVGLEAEESIEKKITPVKRQPGSRPAIPSPSKNSGSSFFNR